MKLLPLVIATPLFEGGRVVIDKIPQRVRVSPRVHPTCLPAGTQVYTPRSLPMGRKPAAHEHKCLASLAMKKIMGFLALAGVVFFAGCIRFHPRPFSPADTATNLENRSLNDPTLQKFLENNLQREPANSPATNWDFDTLLLAAFYYHPSLEVARAQWRVAQAEIKTAGGRPNPSVSIVPGYDFTSTSGLSPWLPAITLDLPP